MTFLVNNVGIQPVDSYLPAHEFPEETWDRILDVNLKSGFLMSKYAVPFMLKQGAGVIVNIASVQGRQSMKGVPAYAASKGGMISLTQQLALEYAEQNIRVLAVNPGTIETSLAMESVNHDLEAPANSRGKNASHGPHRQTGGHCLGCSLSQQRRRLLYDRRIRKCRRRHDGAGVLG